VSQGKKKLIFITVEFDLTPWKLIFTTMEVIFNTLEIDTYHSRN